MAKNDNIQNGNEQKEKKPMDWKKLVLNASMILGVGALYVLSPIDLIPEPLAAAGGAGVYDDVAVGIVSVIGSIVSIVKDYKKIKAGE